MTIQDDIAAALPLLRRFAGGLTRDPQGVEDLVQETACKALTRIDQFTPGTNLHAWLVVILRNEYYGKARRKWREVEDPDSRIASGRQVLGDQEAHMDWLDYQDAASELPGHMLEAVEMVGGLGASYGEAAEALDVPLGTVKSRVSRGRMALRDRLGSLASR